MCKTHDPYVALGGGSPPSPPRLLRGRRDLCGLPLQSGDVVVFGHVSLEADPVDCLLPETCPPPLTGLADDMSRCFAVTCVTLSRRLTSSKNFDKDSRRWITRLVCR